MVIGSSDSRRQFHAIDNTAPGGFKDPYNNDLFMNTLSLPAAAGPFSPTAAERMAVAGPSASDAAERAGAAAMRAYRVKSADGPLHIERGEFHRHSEISADGGGDGKILDQFRYMIDPAAMDWVGCCDHDNGNGREYSWWITQKLTDILYSTTVREMSF